MCLIVFAYKIHPEYPLILAGNRDEKYERPTRPACFWPEAPTLLAGRDLQAGGSWLGITRQGRIAAVTNYRNPAQAQGPRSRGELVTDCLLGPDPTAIFLERLSRRPMDYTGFNLLAGDANELFYHSNRSEDAAVQRLTPGVYGISNHLLDSPWPKLQRAKTEFHNRIQQPLVSPPSLLDMLQDTTLAPDDQLPDTGVGREIERLLSSVFIESSNYGTRASTVILISRRGVVEFLEQSFGHGGQPGERISYRFEREA